MIQVTKVTEKINSLPVPTWRWLGVNQASEANALPQDAPTSQASCGERILPRGVRQVEAPPRETADIPSAMGDAVDRFVLQGADERLFVRAEAAAEEPVRVERRLASGAVDRLHCAIAAEENSRMTLVQVFEGGGPGTRQASLTQINAKAGSQITLIQAQLLEGAAQSWNAVGIRAASGAHVRVIRVTLGGKICAAGIRAELIGDGAGYELDQVYYGVDAQQLDFNDHAIHRGRDTVSRMDTYGVLDGQSQKILRGTIDFLQGAVGAVGHETENVLMLSPKVRNRTVPLILCGEESVEGQHGATIGRLDQEQIYYLCSRGLTAEQAQKLLIEARFAPALDAIADENLRQSIAQAVERRLAAHEIAAR